MGGTWRIGEVSERTGLTRRTLRHYDELGLLVPSARSQGDYRLYAEADLLRLLQIQNLKALGLSLPEIATALADPIWTRRRRCVPTWPTSRTSWKRANASPNDSAAWPAPPTAVGRT